LVRTFLVRIRWDGTLVLRLAGQYISLAIMDVWESVSQEVVSPRGLTLFSLVGYRPPILPPQLMPTTVLIADDHDDSRELLQLLLQGAGYDVHEAKDGRECLILARELQPDLIVMDLSMPVLDGWGVFRELQGDQRTRTIPCVAVSAHADLNRKRALEAGFTAYVSKPFSSEELLKTIAEVVAPSNQV
jgi:two-component system cell cycle response regulator DivK